MILQFPCKPSGLYVLNRFDFDKIAFELLQEKQPCVLNSPMPLDLDALAYDGFLLECIDEVLSKSGSILGLITFADQKIPVLDSNMNSAAISAKEGTIIIEKRLREKPTRYRFTKAHEISHWLLHRKFYSQIKKDYNYRNEGCSYIACRQEARGRKNPVEAKTDYEWTEWQSDNMAAALLMPEVTFVPTAREILGEYGLEQGQLIYGEKGGEASEAIVKLANIYNVSRRSVSIRLNTYGFYSS